MGRKGKLEEIFSKARFADDPFSYKIFYRDFESVRELTLPDFLEESKDFETIPSSRIELIKKSNKILFRKSKR